MALGLVVKPREDLKIVAICSGLEMTNNLLVPARRRTGMLYPYCFLAPSEQRVKRFDGKVSADDKKNDARNRTGDMHT
jgi:hypothetical protein